MAMSQEQIKSAESVIAASLPILRQHAAFEPANAIPDSRTEALFQEAWETLFREVKSKAFFERLKELGVQIAIDSPSEPDKIKETLQQLTPQVLAAAIDQAVASLPRGAKKLNRKSTQRSS